MITQEMLITASGKYKDRLKNPELTQEVKDNIAILLKNINDLFQELKIEKVVVSSGFRPSKVNSNIKGAAKKSAHMIGKACDFEDLDGKLKELVGKHPELLRKYNLMMEDPGSCKTWMHLDDVKRTDRPSRTFKP